MATISPDIDGVCLHPGETLKPVMNEKEKKLRGPIGYLRALVWFITGRFLELDDQVVDGLLDRQKNEQANIALVGALLMTITFSYIPPLLDWEDDWKKGSFGFFTSFCNCMIVCSVSLSTAMLLCLNVLKDDTECRLFLRKIGRFELIPFQTLWAAICTFGFVVGTLQYYKLLSFDNWFNYIVTITYVPAMIIVPLTVIMYMRGLFGLRPELYKVTVLHLDEKAASEAVDSYVAKFFKGSADNIPGCGTEYKEFLAYVKSERGAEYFSRRALINLRNAFDDKCGEYEYEN